MTTPKTIVFFVLLCIPIAFFLFIFSYFGLNIPFDDDIGVFRSLIIDLPQAKTIKEKVAIFFIPQNEHPIAIYKFFVWVYYVIFSEINIKYINLLGNLIFLSSLGLFLRQLQIIRVSWIWLIPIPYILFSLYSYENALWALCSFQHTVIITLYLGGLYCCLLYKETSYRFYLGVFLLACVAVCSGNGTLGFIIVFFILLLEKRVKSAFIIGLILTLIKFFLLPKQSFHQPNSFKEIVQSFFILCGSIGKITTTKMLIISMGVFLVVGIILFSIYSIFAKLKRKDRLYFLMTCGICLFGIGTFIGLAIFRNISSSLFPDRYRVYTHLLWIGLYLFTIPFITKINFQRPLFYLAVIGSVSYFVFAFYTAIPYVLFSYHQKVVIPINYYYANTSLCGCSYRDYFDETLKVLAEKNIYRLPKPMFDPRQIDRISSVMPLNIQKFNSESIHVSSLTPRKINNPRESGLFILLSNSIDPPFLAPVLQDINSAKKLLFNTHPMFKGFQSVFFKTCFPDDVYKVQIVVLNNKKMHFFDSAFSFDSKDFKVFSR